MLGHYVSPTMRSADGTCPRGVICPVTFAAVWVARSGDAGCNRGPPRALASGPPLPPTMPLWYHNALSGAWWIAHGDGIHRRGTMVNRGRRDLQCCIKAHFKLEF